MTGRRACIRSVFAVLMAAAATAAARHQENNTDGCCEKDPVLSQPCHLRLSFSPIRLIGCGDFRCSASYTCRRCPPLANARRVWRHVAEMNDHESTKAQRGQRRRAMSLSAAQIGRYPPSYFMKAICNVILSPALTETSDAGGKCRRSFMPLASASRIPVFVSTLSTVAGIM